MASLQKSFQSLMDCAKILGLRDEDLDIAKDYLSRHELGLSFDQVVIQIYESDIEINNDFFTLAESVAKELHLHFDDYSFLKELIRDENTIPKTVKDELSAILKSLN
jgi:hypothetical protein